MKPFFQKSTDGKKQFPACWGHRGASAAFPENTLASFEAAIKEGAEGLESDVHVTKDGVILMFHDPNLDRTTDSKGAIKERNYYGEDGIEHVRTVKKPVQAIPLFKDTIDLLLKPENRHVVFNVDVKIQNDPPTLFAAMAKIIMAHDQWETALAPRILLGLWHPRFLPAAKEHLPQCRRSVISMDTSAVRKYWWDHVDTFSMQFNTLATVDGQRFLQESKAAGKAIMVWTVNEPEFMAEAVRWNVDAILTDVPKVWLDMRKKLQDDYEKTINQYGRSFLWTMPRFYTPLVKALAAAHSRQLRKLGGDFELNTPVVTA